MLLERMFGEVNDKQADYLEDIHSSGRHLLNLINDILDLSKVEAGRMELDLGAFDLPTAIGNAIALIRERAQKHAEDLAKRIAAMQEMQRTLQHLTHCCHGDERPECPILEELAK